MKQANDRGDAFVRNLLWVSEGTAAFAFQPPANIK
jgi:hypothetical protein